MNVITWLFYIIQRVIVIPTGSVNEMKATQEDAENWYKTLQDSEHKLHKLYKNVFSFWGFKVLLLVSSIILIPYLRRIYTGTTTDKTFTEE
jgi:hypothetical protein